MGLIEKTQKEVIFEEAAKRGLIKSDLLNLEEVYQDILGIRDLGQARYGFPLTQHYLARPNDLIDVDKIRTYFENLHRDYQVLDTAAGSAEDQIAILILEIWSRIQRAKNRADYLSKIATTEKLKSSLQAVWSYTETFNQTDLLDMQQTTAWIDTSEGTARLPIIGKDTTVHPDDMVIGGYTIPNGGDTLGSHPSMAVDGIATTNWRCLFTVEGNIELVLEFRTPKAMSAITVDPIGFGLSLQIDLEDSSGVWTTAIKDVIYKKRTWPMEYSGVQRAKVTFHPAETTLPKTAGIRELTFFTSKVASNARIQTKLLRPSYPYTEVKVVPSADIPKGSNIQVYYSRDAVTWTPVSNNDWAPVADLTTTVITLDDQEEYKNSQSFNGIYRIDVGKPASTPNTGTMEIGINQAELSCFRRDWGVEGEVLRILHPEDFSEEAVNKTWTYVQPKAESEITFSGTSMIGQLYGQAIYNPPYNFKRGNKIAMARKVTNRQYEEMMFVPLVGSANYNPMQYGFSYRFRYLVHARDDVVMDTGSYWFLQGYKTPGSPRNAETGRSFGTFALYVNKEKVASQDIGHTIYSDNTVEAAGQIGQSWALRLNKGWNEVEVLFYLIDPIIYSADRYQEGDPYLQLTLYPSLFDSNVQRDLNIDKIIASGMTKPTNEFDLIWNLPKSPEYWAWSQDRSYLLINQKETTPIDGFYRGTMPQSVLVYRGSDIGSQVNNLYIRIEADKDPASLSGPILDEVKVFVR